MSKLDHFEESLRNSIDGFEVPYNSADWEKLSQQMDKKQGGYGSSLGLYIGILASAIVIGGALYYADFDNSELADNNNLKIAENQSTENQEDTQNTANFNDAAISDTESSSLDILSDESSIDETSNSSNGLAAEKDKKSNLNDNTTPQPAENRADKIKSEKSEVASGKSNTSDSEESSERKIKSSKAETVALGTHAGAANSEEEKVDDGFISNERSSCEGSNISFKLDNVNPGTHYLWNFGDGTFSNEPEPEHVYGKAGKYQVTLVRSGGNGGKNIHSDPAVKNVEIFASPQANFNHIARSEAKKLPFIHFENASISASDWVWDFGDGNTSKDVHPDHVYKKAGTYQVKLKVFNGNGCTDEVSKSVTVTSKNPLKAPSTFSPNGDGVKDTFFPEVLKELNSPFKFSVYEKTGALIFTSYSSSNTWSGLLESGEMAPAGDYVWMVNFLDGEYRDQTFQGTTSLLH